MEIKEFRDQYYFLSNFYSAPVVFEGVKYANNEAAFQAQKDPSRSKEFAQLPPNKAKSLGRRVKLRDDWEEKKILIMEKIVEAKFRQNPHLLTKLLNTKSAKLAEGNWWGDTFWGVCKGRGENHLGIILMKVRDKLRKERSEAIR